MAIDSHAHLDAPDFDPDRAETIARARNAGVDRILAIGGGTKPAELDRAIAIAEQFAGIDASIGIHPHEAKEATPESFDCLNALAGRTEVVAWGEIGLDFHYLHSTCEIQTEVFDLQLEMASTAELPVIIHTREAEEETIEILQTRSARNTTGGVMHCYSGSWELARKCLDLGFFISFSGMITFPKAEQVRDVARRIPLDRLLVETDSPYLAPVPYRGKRNEPSFVTETTAAMARLRDIPVEELNRQIVENYCRAFPKAARRMENLHG